MKKIGLIVNPIAGMGGRVGLKGTDGQETLAKAKELGASQEAPEKAKQALKELLPLKEDLLLLTAAGEMGESIGRELGFETSVLYHCENTCSGTDTINAAQRILEEKPDLLLFAGGDGTARDIYQGIGLEQGVVGIPAGVKIHSPVYANTPKDAGRLAKEYLEGKLTLLQDLEVVDIDEVSYREDRLITSLYGYLKVPVSNVLLQNKKAPTPLTQEASQRAIALDIIDNMAKDVAYIVGPGSTTQYVNKELGIPSTLLGVDVIRNRKLYLKDATEKDLLRITNEFESVLIMTPTGGQGYLFGRGNQQISGNVLKQINKENIRILATTDKIAKLKGKPLRIYTGDDEADQRIVGYYRIKTGYGMEMMYPVRT